MPLFIKTHKAYSILFSLAAMFIASCSVAQVTTTITDIWISEAPPMSRVNAGYFSISNQDNKAINLTDVSSPDFGNIEMHLSVVEDGIAKMVRQNEISIAPGTTFRFEPGGYHLMLFDARDRYLDGDKVNIIFNFSDGSVIESTAEVKPLSNKMDHSSHANH